MLKYNHGEKSQRVLFIIYANLEPLLEKIKTYPNNFKTSSLTTKRNKHTTSGYSLFTKYSFDVTKHKLNYYRRKICMERFCFYFVERSTQKSIQKKIINYEKKEMIPLTNKERKLHRKQ